MSTAEDTPPLPPIAKAVEFVREHHGDRVVDHYEWLRDKSDPDVVDYLKAENDYAEAMTAGLAALRGSIFQEIKSRVLETDLSVPVASGPWWYYTRTLEGMQYAVHCRAPGGLHSARPALEGDAPVAGEQVLLDGNEAAEGHEFFSMGAFTVSPDHSRLAYATDTEGDERFDLTVKDIASGEVLDDAVTGIGYGCVFSLDGEWVFYTRVDDAWRPYQIWRHRLGSPVGDDVMVYEEPDERFWMGLGASRDDRWILIGIGSRTTSEARILDAAEPTGEFRVVAPRRDGVEYDVEPAADRLLILHNEHHKDFDLAWAPLDATSHEDWRPVLESAPGERFLGIDAFDDYAVLSLRADGLTGLRILPLSEGEDTGFGPARDLPFDEPLYSVGIGDNPEPSQTTIQLVFESLVTPKTVYDCDVATGALTLLKRQPVLGGYDPAAFEQRREWATAADGTRIPMSLVYLRGTEPDRSNPGFLTAYGSYEASSDPYFSVARLSLLERGMVFALAHVRGGGELGRAWYEEGKLLHKKNTFTDFIACADHLVSSGWVNADRLVAEGGSAGGLLIGAAVNMAPDRFRAVHAAVPFVDALTTILRPDLPLTVGEWEEWGNPLEDPQVYAYMKSYTPYENISDTSGRRYPAILATTSLNDTRVFFTEPAKWVARLRSTLPPDPERPVLLRTEMVAGHGGRSGRYSAWEQTAWEWAFLLDQVGLGTPVGP